MQTRNIGWPSVGACFVPIISDSIPILFPQRNSETHPLDQGKPL